mmetsp:Transcript_82352/g.197543  ORF Transcript_82352/g.197543 Transcript_82352/m.197543 type:complete len:483 (+) Transcript_82352:792-2240(+)
MLLQEQQRGIEIRVVKLIGHAPPNGSELPPLLHDAMQECDGVQQRAPLLMIHLVQGLLSHHGGVGPVKRCLQTSRGLLGHFDAEMQKPDGEPRGDLAGHPQPVIRMDLGHSDDGLLHLVHVVDPQVAILQHQPSPGDEGGVVLLPRHLLLALTHGDLVSWELLFPLGEFIDHVGGVGASRQQVEHWLPSARLLVDLEDGIAHWGCESGTQLSINILRASDADPVLTQRTDQHEPDEGAQSSLHDDSVFILRNRAVLRLALIQPPAPADVIPPQKLSEVTEQGYLLPAETVAGELDDVEPHLLVDPFAIWARLLRVLVQRSSRLQEEHHIIAGQLAVDNGDLQGDHQPEHHLVPLKETPVHVAVHLVREEVDDLVHPLYSRLDLVRVFHRVVKLLEELIQGAAVHPAAWLQCDGIADQHHVSHVEIHQASSSCHWPELLSLLVDLKRPLTGFVQLAFHLFCFCFGACKDFNELGVVQEVALGA